MEPEALVSQARAALRIGDATTARAALELPPPEMRQLLGTMVGNQEAMDGFVSVVSGAVSPVDLFSESNVQRIFARFHIA